MSKQRGYRGRGVQGKKYNHLYPEVQHNFYSTHFWYQVVFFITVRYLLNKGGIHSWSRGMKPPWHQLQLETNTGKTNFSFTSYTTCSQWECCAIIPPRNTDCCSSGQHESLHKISWLHLIDIEILWAKPLAKQKLTCALRVNCTNERDSGGRQAAESKWNGKIIITPLSREVERFHFDPSVSLPFTCSLHPSPSTVLHGCPLLFLPLRLFPFSSIKVIFKDSTQPWLY